MRNFRLNLGVHVKKVIIHSWVVCLMVICSPVVLAGDYLDELASEAEATASVSKKNQLSVTERKEQKQMEEILSEKKPSTYKYYVKLNTKNKQYAYEKWVTDPSKQEDRLHHLQKKIMDLYFNQ